MPKIIKLGLQDSISATYNKTKTTYNGRVSQSTKEGQLVLGPPLTRFIDIMTDQGFAPGQVCVNAQTGRIFALQNINSGVATISAHNFNATTGDCTIIGKIMVNPVAGTRTIRGFNVDDSNPTNIKIFIATTVSTTTCLGGMYIVDNVDLSDFTISGTMIYPASSTSPGQKASYSMQYASEVGRNHLGITSGGVGLGRYTSTDIANKTKYFMQNGAATTLQIYGFDYSIGPCDVAGKIVNGVSCQTSPYSGTSPAAYFTMGASNNGYSTLANTVAAFEAVIVQDGTNPVPSNFSSTAPNSNQNVYYVRDLQLVSGQWYFNLSASSIGVAVPPTSATTNFTMMRAYGISTSHSIFKTGILSPAPAGTLLTNQTFGCITPANVPIAPSLNNEDCIQLATSSSLVLAKISDLTDGGTTWPSMSQANAFGSGTDFILPSIAMADYSSVLDKWIFQSTTFKLHVKSHQNNSLDKVGGGIVTKYYETLNPPSIAQGLAAVISLKAGNGWIVTSGGSIGQRGLSLFDLLSDSMFDTSYVISPIKKVENNSILRFVRSIKSLVSYTDDINVYIRSANSASDPIFNSPTGGWILTVRSKDNNPMAIGPYFQVKVTFEALTDNQASPAQLNDLMLTYTSPYELSDYWAGDVDNTSRNGEVPTRTAFYLTKTYTTSVPQLFFRAYDPAGALVITADTVTDTSSFEYSTDNGTTWLPLGTIPNTAGTLVRYKWTSPPGTNIFASLREE